MKMQKLKSKMLTKLKKLEDVLLFLTLLFLPTQLGKHFWPQFSYIYSLKIDYLSPTIYFWDILVIGLLIIWILGKPKINRLALNLLLFFLFTQALSLPGASNLGAGLVRLEQYAIAGFLGLYLASLKNIKVVYLPLLLGILGESLIAILQFLKGSTLGLWVFGERSFTITTPGIAKFDFYGLEFLRPYGTFPHPNVLAGYLLVIVCSLWFIVYGKKHFLKVISTVAAIAIFLTMSRTAILAGLVPLVLIMKRKWLIFALLILLVVSPILFTRFSSLLNFDNLAVVRREELIGNSWQMFLASPIFGVGLNNFIPAQASNLITGPSRFLQPVHNIFFLTLAETGIIGLVGFLVLIGYPIKKMYNVKCTIYNFLPWLIIIFLGMFDHYFLTLPQGYRLLFLVWGLSFSAKMTR